MFSKTYSKVFPKTHDLDEIFAKEERERGREREKERGRRDEKREKREKKGEGRGKGKKEEKSEKRKGKKTLLTVQFSYFKGRVKKTKTHIWPSFNSEHFA